MATGSRRWWCNKVEIVKWKPVKKISATERGEGGFGHTGKI